MKITQTNPVVQFRDRAPPLQWCLKGKRSSCASGPFVPSQWLYCSSSPQFFTTLGKNPLQDLSSLLPSIRCSRFFFPPPPCPQPTCSINVHVLSYSLLLSHYVGLTTWWNRISGSAPSLLFAKARWVVSCECLNRLYIPTVHIVRRYQILGGKRFEEKSVLNTILDFEGTPTRWPEIFKAKKNPPVFKKVSSF